MSGRCRATRHGATTPEKGQFSMSIDRQPEGAALAAVTPAGATVSGVDVAFGAADLIAAWR